MTEQSVASMTDELARALYEREQDTYNAPISPIVGRFLQRAFDLGARSGGVSERERQMLRRDGFIRACQDFSNLDSENAIIQAHKTFPAPRVTRPLRVTLFDKSVWSWDGSMCERHDEDYGPYPLRSALDHVCEARDVALLARILSGETEEVESDEPAPAPCSSRGSLNDVQGINGIRY